MEKWCIYSLNWNSFYNNKIPNPIIILVNQKLERRKNIEKDAGRFIVCYCHIMEALFLHFISLFILLLASLFQVFVSLFLPLDLVIKIS